MAAEPTEQPRACVCPADGCTKAFPSDQQLQGHIGAKAPYCDDHEALLSQPVKTTLATSKRDEHREETTSAECRAMRILYRDGWSNGVLKMTFQLSRPGQVRHHLSGRCTHGHDEPPVILDD